MNTSTYQADCISQNNFCKFMFPFSTDIFRRHSNFQEILNQNRTKRTVSALFVEEFPAHFAIFAAYKSTHIQSCT